MCSIRNTKCLMVVRRIIVEEKEETDCVIILIADMSADWRHITAFKARDSVHMCCTNIRFCALPAERQFALTRNMNAQVFMPSTESVIAVIWVRFIKII